MSSSMNGTLYRIPFHDMSCTATEPLSSLLDCAVPVLWSLLCALSACALVLPAMALVLLDRQLQHQASMSLPGVRQRV